MNSEQSIERSALGDIFDRTFRALNNIPDATATKPSTVRHVHPVLETTQTFIVSTVRHRERGDTIFVEAIGKDGSIRLALPPEVAEVIARQRDALTAKNRSKAGKLRAAQDKAAGRVPGFMRSPRAKKRKKTKAKSGEAKEE